MKHSALWERRTSRNVVVAPASATTWVVAFSRHLIPGACFRTRAAAVDYASMLARAAGMRTHIKVLGDA